MKKNRQYKGQNRQYRGQNRQYKGQNRQYRGQNRQYKGQNRQYRGQNRQYKGQNRQYKGQNTIQRSKQTIQRSKQTIQRSKQTIQRSKHNTKVKTDNTKVKTDNTKVKTDNTEVKTDNTKVKRKRTTIHTKVHKIVLSGKLLRLSQHGTKSCRYISVYVIRQNKQNYPPTIWNRKITLKFKNILLHFIWLQFVIHQKIAVYPYIEEEQTTLAKRKRTKRQTMIYKTLHIKLRSSNTNPTNYRGWTRVLGKDKQFLLH